MQIGEGKTVRLGDVTQQPRLPLEPTSAFLLTHTELGWFPATLDGEPIWLPKLKPMPLMGGCLGVKAGRGEGDPPIHGPAVDRMRRRKIPRVVLEAEVPEYLRSYPCQGRSGRKGDYYCDAWERPELIAGEYSPSRDNEGYHRWLLSLLEREIIAPPHPRVVERIAERYRGHVVRLSSLQQSPGVEARVAEEERLMEAATSATKKPKARRAKKAGPTGG